MTYNDFLRVWTGYILACRKSNTAYHAYLHNSGQQHNNDYVKLCWTPKSNKRIHWKFWNITKACLCMLLNQVKKNVMVMKWTFKVEMLHIMFTLHGICRPRGSNICRYPVLNFLVDNIRVPSIKVNMSV